MYSKIYLTLRSIIRKSW